MTSNERWTVPAAGYQHPLRDDPQLTALHQALLGGLKLVSDFGESFLEDVLTGVCDISGVSILLLIQEQHLTTIRLRIPMSAPASLQMKGPRCTTCYKTSC